MQKAAVQPAKKRRKFNEEGLWCYIFIAPVMLGILVFSIGPTLYALYMSLTNWDGFLTPEFVGLANFRTLFTEPSIKTEFVNTLRYAAVVVPVTLGLAIVLANLLNMNIRGRSLYRTLYFLPNVTMATAVAIVWRWLFNTEFGLIGQVSKALGLPAIGWISDANYIMPAIWIIGVWGGLGYAAVIMLAGLQGIPKTYYEAADIDGASGLRQFFHITIPLLTPTIFFLLITSLINAFKTFDVIFMFAAKGNLLQSEGPLMNAVRTMVYGIYYRGFGLFKMGYASAEAVLLFAIILLITLLQFYMQKKWVFYDH